MRPSSYTTAAVVGGKNGRTTGTTNGSGGTIQTNNNNGSSNNNNNHKNNNNNNSSVQRSSTPAAAVSLDVAYPANAVMELRLAPDSEIVRGTVYCTDDTADVIVLRRPLLPTSDKTTATTATASSSPLVSDIRIVHASSVVEKRLLPKPNAATGTTAASLADVDPKSGTSSSSLPAALITGTSTATTTTASSDGTSMSSMTTFTAEEDAQLLYASPLPPLLLPTQPTTNNNNNNNNNKSQMMMQRHTTTTSSTLDEKERKYIRMAKEALRQINQTTTPIGQAVFDRLLKACNDEVVWDGQSIIVLNQVRIDPPYKRENCSLVQQTKTMMKDGDVSVFMEKGDSTKSQTTATATATTAALNEGSLERVRKIVAAATTTQ